MGATGQLANPNETNGETLSAALRLASGDLCLPGVTSIKIGCGVSRLASTAQADEGLLIWWIPGRRSELYRLEHSPAQRLDLQKLLGNRSDPFVQFKGSLEEGAKAVRQEFPDVANSRSFRDPQMPAFRELEWAKSVRPRSADLRGSGNPAQAHSKGRSI